jgi:hypothetical protein
MYSIRIHGKVRSSPKNPAGDRSNRRRFTKRLASAAARDYREAAIRLDGTTALLFDWTQPVFDGSLFE